ncbi:MAG: 1,4-dihydroxy-2-naphthoyl-CoA synthase [bacterium]|nr:1,4-dihydroxy-2-naphthoyl-CoA synthase [bacterium]
MDFEDLLYEKRDHVATITINRPKVYNAFRGTTCAELVRALADAGYDKDIGAIVLTGAGDRAFCTGGDQSEHDGQYEGDRGILGMPIDEVHSVIRDVPKPVLAKVRGYAIGGGNVLATLCDLTLAADNAIFGQVGPKMGSVDPGFGTAYLSRVIGEKKAREMWYLCERYSAAEALEMGLVNKVVPEAELDAEAAAWCAKLVQRSPTAIALAKRSFNADSESIRGIGGMGFVGLSLYYGTKESEEGGAALNEKRDPDFRRFV